MIMLISDLCASVARKLRNHGLYAGTVRLILMHRKPSAPVKTWKFGAHGPCDTFEAVSEVMSGGGLGARGKRKVQAQKRWTQAAAVSAVEAAGDDAIDVVRMLLEHVEEQQPQAREPHFSDHENKPRTFEERQITITLFAAAMNALVSLGLQVPKLRRVVTDTRGVGVRVTRLYKRSRNASRSSSSPLAASSCSQEEVRQQVDDTSEDDSDEGAEEETVSRLPSSVTMREDLREWMREIRPRYIGERRNADKEAGEDDALHRLKTYAFALVDRERWIDVQCILGLLKGRDGQGFEPKSRWGTMCGHLIRVLQNAYAVRSRTSAELAIHPV